MIRENDLYARAFENARRERHYMGNDVPFWVEDTIESCLSLLLLFWQLTWKAALLAAIITMLTEVYLICNNIHPYPFGELTSLSEGLAICIAGMSLVFRRIPTWPR